MEVSSTDVAFFHQHGWWLSPPVFSDAELQRAIAEQDRYYLGEHDRDDPVAGMPYPGWNPVTGGALELRKNDYASYRNPSFASNLLSKPEIAAFARALMSVDGVRLWHDQLLYKPPLPPGANDRSRDGIVAFGWHTDHNYWRSCTGPLLTAWIPFTEITPEMGPLVMIDGSHCWDEIGGMEFYDDDLDAVIERIAAAGHEVVEVPVVMQRGQVSFHHWHTIHGSRPNRSGQARRSMAIHLQADCNRWQEVIDPVTGSPFEHRNDRLVRRTPSGTPDYTDPVFCPALA